MSKEVVCEKIYDIPMTVAKKITKMESIFCEVKISTVFAEIFGHMGHEVFSNKSSKSKTRIHNRVSMQVSK